MENDRRTDDTDVIETKPSIRVVERVADAEDVDPHALDPPLYDAIDPEALDRLSTAITDGSTTRGRISFQYHGYDLSVDATGHVELH